MNSAPSPPRYIANGYAVLFAILPWSVDVNFGSWNLTVLSEPLIGLLGLFLAWEVAYRPSRSIPGRSWILWMAVSVCFSTMTLVSIKFWLVETGHWWVFAVGMTRWPGLWRRVLPYFVFSMVGVVLYTIVHHGFYHFRVDQALLSPMPFFPDNTMYAAILALLIFITPCGIVPDVPLFRFYHHSWIKKGLVSLFIIALLLSCSRAAFCSLVISSFILAAYYFRDKWPYLLTGTLLLGLWGLPVIREKTSLSLSKDVSYQERLNRWDCAKSMVEARAWTGFGPGTFQFQYLPFQKPEKMTRISARVPLAARGPDTYGRGGGAHSEYWQAAAEMGWPGLLLWVTLVFGTLWKGFKRVAPGVDLVEKHLSLFVTLGLLTFFTHALVNNFLHDGRVAALVWGGMAWLWQQPEDKRDGL